MQSSSIEDRLNRLERQNHRLRIMLLALIVLAGVGLLSSVRPVRAQAPKWQRTVEAEKFVLRDASGKMRAVLGTEPSGPNLTLYNSSGKARAELSVILDYPNLALYDASGKQRVSLDVDPVGPGLALGDGFGKLRVALQSSADGPSLTLQDSAGFKSVIGHTALQTPATGEQSQTSAASIHLFNRKGNVIWAAP